MPQLYGVGPVITGIILGEGGDVARFKNGHHFASYNGTAPDDKGSAGHPAYCVNIKGNRKLNHAMHMVAITQIRNSRSPGRAHYDRKSHRDQDHQSRPPRPEAAHLRRHLPPTVPRRRTRSGPGRANGDDSSIQRDRPNPDDRPFGQATTRTRTRA